MKLAPKPLKPTKILFFVVACGLAFLLIGAAGVHKPSPRSAVQIFAVGAELMIFFFLTLWVAGLLVIWVWSGLTWMWTYLAEMWSYLKRR